MIQTLHDTGEDYTILSKYDGGVYSLFNDGIIRDIGDDFEINYSTDSLNVSFNAGSEAIIGGSFYKVTSLEAITLIANATIYLCANIDLSRPNGSTGQFVQRTSSNMQHDNINGNGVSRDLLLYVITTGANGVISVQDRRTYASTSYYPVGSIYMSVNNTNPSLIFGGTWQQLKDRFLLGAGDTYQVGNTGGEAAHTLTIQEMPSHNHTVRGSGYSANVGGGSSNYGVDTVTSSSTGGNQPHNNMPPYLVVYMWQRIL